MAKYSTDSELPVFRHLNEDGKISASDLALFTKTIGIDLSPEDIEGSVEFNEEGLLWYEELAMQLNMGDTEEEERIRDLREAFGMFAVEGEGCVTAESLKRMLSRLGIQCNVEECQSMICRFDLDGDGVLTFDEFKIMMM